MNITDTAKRNFLTLLTAYFAASALFSVLGLLLINNLLPAFNITINGHERSVTSYLFQGCYTISCMMIFVRLMSIKNYGLTAKSRIGLCLMAVSLFQNGLSDILFLNTDYSNVYSSFYISLMEVAFLVIEIIGLFMFINGSPAEKKLKRFVKWTPFINIIATFVLSIAIVIVNKPRIMSSPEYHMIFTSISLIVFLTVYHMAQQSVREEIQSTDTGS